MLAAQATLGATDSGPIEPQAKMAGQPQTPGVGDALTIDQYRIGKLLQTMKSVENHRQFPKGEQTGHIGESYPPAGGHFLDDGQVSQAQHHYRGEKQIAMALIGDIDPSYRFGQERQFILQTDLAGQFFLQGDRFPAG